MWQIEVQPHKSQMAIKYGACAFRAGYLGLQTPHSACVILFAFHSNNGLANAAQCYADTYIAFLVRTEVRPRCWVFSSGLHQVGSNWWRQPRLRVRWKVAESIIRLSFILVKQHRNLVLQPTYQLWRALRGVLAK